MHDEVSAFRDVYQAMHRYLRFPALLCGFRELLDIGRGVFWQWDWSVELAGYQGIRQTGLRQPV